VRDWRKIVNVGIKRRGWTQAELARRAGVAPSWLCRWLKTKRGISGAVLARLLDAIESRGNANDKR
jgi:transcriptional regulator with XRE-family HTH domain